MDKLYVKQSKKRGEKPSDFLERLYDNIDYGIKTYEDVECSAVSCTSNSKHRSFNDLYRVFKTYYPKISQKKVMEMLYKKACFDNEFHFILCPHIERVVFYNSDWDGTDCNFLFNDTVLDYGAYFKNGRSVQDKYTLKYLFKKIEFTEEDIKQELNY